MRGSRSWVLVFLGVILPLGVVRAGWWDDLDRGEEVKLSDLIAQPSRYEGRILSFFCVFHRRDQVFAPLAAPYTPQRFENFAVWPDGAPIWEEEAYQKDYPFLYLERAHPQQADLLGLEMFTRVEVTGRIRGAIRARPCSRWSPSGRPGTASAARSCRA